MHITYQLAFSLVVLVPIIGLSSGEREKKRISALSSTSPWLTLGRSFSLDFGRGEVFD